MGNRCVGLSSAGYPDKEFNSVGAVLDRAVSQCGHYINDCPLYNLVNYQKGGLLVDVYSKEGNAGLRRVLGDTKTQGCMYGPEATVTKRELNRWKRMQNREISVIIDHFVEEKDANTDPLNVFQEHSACWKLNSRGMLGESLLHCMLICNTKVHSHMAKITLSVLPKLAIDVIEGDEYFGVSALHLSIVYNEIDLMKALVENGADINQRATGRFFRPTDQQRNARKNTNYEGLCYMGEYPLAWAASCGNEAAYNYLLSKDADPNLQDSYGNSVLHMLVINNMQEMYGFALRHPKKPANNSIVNYVGLTPLTMACKLGRNEIFRSMLELSALEFWRYSNITCSGYPLNALDSILPNGKINWNSALMIILSGQKEQHLNMLNGGVIQRLLEEKWKTFARTQFIKRLGILGLHLLLLTLAIFLRPPYSQPLIGSIDAKSIIRYCAELGSCLGCFIYVVYQQGSEIFAQGIIGFFFNLTSSPPKTIFLISNLLLLTCIPVRAFGSRTTEDMLLSLVFPSSWFFLMFFAGAIRLTGPFVTMIYQMLTGDMLRFGIILSIFLLGFSQAFFFLYKNFPRPHKMYETYPDTWMALLHMMLGEYEFADLDETIYHVLTKIVFAMFMILMPILLLNMLIAMMGNTYLQIITRSEKEWMKQWASIVLNLERSLDEKLARQHMQAYSIKLSTTDDQDPDMEQRVVMVIKSKSKSKAKQRRAALYNWKKIGKRIIDELKKRGGTAQLFYEYERLATEEKDARKVSKCSNFSDMGDSDATIASKAIDKIGNTLNQLAWANDLKLQMSNPLRATPFSEQETTTNAINGFIPADNVHPGQDVRHRSFNDTKNAVVDKATTKSDKRSSKTHNVVVDIENSVKRKHTTVRTKRKKRKHFLKPKNKVGVVHTNIVQSCVSNVVSSLSDEVKSTVSEEVRAESEPKMQNEATSDVPDCEPMEIGRSFHKVNDGNVSDSDLDVQTRFKERTRLTNWSTRQVIPMTDIVQWDNKSDDK